MIDIGQAGKQVIVSQRGRYHPFTEDCVRFENAVDVLARNGARWLIASSHNPASGCDAVGRH